MQDRPDKVALLGAISHFLEKEVRPAVKDAALNFRVLIAAHLAHTVAAEIQAEDALEANELSRLRMLLPDLAAPELEPKTRADRREMRLVYKKELARLIREHELSDEKKKEVLIHVMQMLRQDLKVYNPRFNTSDEE